MNDTTYITRHQANAAIDLLKRYRDQDPHGCGQAIEAAIINAGLVSLAPKAPKREPGALARPLPDDLSALTLAQVTIHDNWGQDRKPRNRLGKNGKRAREAATRFGLSLVAWDQPADDINLASRDWAYSLSGDILTADEFRAKALDLMNVVLRDGEYVRDPKRRNAVLHPISEDCGIAMIEMANAATDPSDRFACLKTKARGSGTAVVEFQWVRVKLQVSAVGPRFEEAAIITRNGALHLPAFSMRQAGGAPFNPASRAVAQSRFARDDADGFANWRTAGAPSASLITSNH